MASCINMGREELELHFSPSRWSHRMGPEEVINSHIQVLNQGSEEARQGDDCELDVSYGDSEKQKLDIFGAKTLPNDAPIIVYIHGGYWRQLSREMSSFMAPTLTRSGAVVVSVGYDLAPEVNLDEITAQIRSAVVYVLAMATRRGSSGVYLSGHCAGAHLAAMMLVHDWEVDSNINSCLLKGAFLISGIYDVTPLVNTYINDPLYMTHEDAVRNSPVTYLEKLAELSGSRRLLVAYGDNDPPAFQSQNVELIHHLEKLHVDVKLMKIEDCDHFSSIERLRFADDVLTKEIVNMMGPISRECH